MKKILSFVFKLVIFVGVIYALGIWLPRHYAGNYVYGNTKAVMRYFILGYAVIIALLGRVVLVRFASWVLDISEALYNKFNTAEHREGAKAAAAKFKASAPKATNAAAATAKRATEKVHEGVAAK